MGINEKLEVLKKNLKELKSVAVAYSAGVDSTFLLTVAHEVLCDNVIAVTAKSSTYPEREFKEAEAFTKKIGVKHIVMVSEELDIKGYSKNPTNRCYYCKTELYTKVKNIAKENDIANVVDGANLDDMGDFRPGMVAAKELGIISPLKMAGMTKDDIRKLSKEYGLKTWNKPSFACLSSRVPYGSAITSKKLKMIEKSEQFLLDLGFKQVRVRHHGEIARIEVAPEEREKFFDSSLMDKIGLKLKEFGFKYVTLDLLGYRTGSMNEVLTDKEKDLESK
ncbi:MAG: ATP-dependent sacrificial sulfur transferase LarE [Clostridium sp.]|nr:ATP-dependent sacrificial sulfur transferase LarE [Clostridium sp.]